MKFLKNLLYSVPLTWKMVLLTVVLAVLVGNVTNLMTAKSTRKIFRDHILSMLKRQSLEQRIRFDNYINDYSQLAAIFVSGGTLESHFKHKEHTSSNPKYSKFTSYPDWFPTKSLMRSLAIPRFVLLYSEDGQLIEAYFGRHEKTFPQMFNISLLTIEKSIDTSHLTSFDDQLFLVSSKYLNHESMSAQYLVLASPVDEFFFIQVRGDFPEQLSGLLTSHNKRILTSSNSRLIPPGTSLSTIEERYLVHFHEFHEYGGAETQINFATFTPKIQVIQLTKPFMQQFNLMSMIMIASIVSVIVLIIYSFARRIETITTKVINFTGVTSGVLGGQLKNKLIAEHGDEIFLLDESFSRLSREIARKTKMLEEANSELQQSIESLIETREELAKAEKMAIIGQMSGIVAHELLNPITSISIRVEKNISYGVQALKVVKELNSIIDDTRLLAQTADEGSLYALVEDSCKRVSRFTNALEQNQSLRLEDFHFLDGEIQKVIRIVDGFRERSRREKVIEDVNMQIVLNDVIKEFEDRLSRSTIKLSVNTSAVPLIQGDFMEFHSIFANIINNAIHAIENNEDGSKRELTITMGPHDHNLIEATVHDTGKGIARNKWESVFLPSFTTKGRKGTGLGLAISRKIARSHKGDLLVHDSVQKKGTTFQILLGTKKVSEQRRNNEA